MQLTPFRTSSTACVLTVIAALLVAACSYTTGSFDEPALRGKLIDADTSQPIQGAVIYGYYATAEGSLGGGEMIKEVLRVFEVESGADGTFEVPAWKTGWSITRGEPRQNFPTIAIYKDGYRLDLQNLTTIANWVSRTQIPGGAKRAADLIDWTAAPVQLKPAKTDRERYETLDLSNYGYADIGPCGWEQHVKLLAAQHVAWKSFLKRNVPTEHLRSDGYSRGTYSLPDSMISAMQTSISRMDKLLELKAKATDWRCADPGRIFIGELQ